jgi:2-oxoglutarate ferredoxin oxidoreductase subunit beta
LEAVKVDPKDFDIMDEVDYDIAWCPGCGNFVIRDVMKKTLAELNLKPQEVVMVTGIGQAAKMPHYMRLNFFNGLHGRSLPVATAIKAVNPDLTVIAESGDGCMYGEGGNHFTHTILRNPDITMIVHDNMVYGLTRGQASPTSQIGFETGIQVADRCGVTNRPMNPIALAISQGASFVARANIGDGDESKDIIKQAIKHRGFALVDIFQPCVTYNKLNTFKWFKENTYYLEDGHDKTDPVEAFKRALETDRYPLGIFYAKERETFGDNTLVYEKDKRPLYMRDPDRELIKKELEALKRK